MSGGLMLRVVLTVVCCASISATGQTWTYTRIADSTTVIPGTSGTFASFGIPSVVAGEIGFYGFNSQVHGMYRGAGGPLTVVADSATPIPGGTGNFTAFTIVERYWPS